MKIRFATNDSGGALGACLLAALGMFLLAISHTLRQLTNECHTSSVHSNMSNLTSSTEDKSPFCRLHYEKCLCSVLSNKTKNAENCITDIALQCSRILPLVSYLLQICLLRQLFTLEADFNRKLIYIAYIAALFTFIGFMIGIFWNSCYLDITTLVIFLLWIPLCLPTAHQLGIANRREGELQYERIFMEGYRLGRTRNEIKSWQELL